MTLVINNKQSNSFILFPGWPPSDNHTANYVP